MDQSHLMATPSSYNSVHAFTSCPTVEGPNDFLMYTEEVRMLDLPWQEQSLLLDAGPLPGRTATQHRPAYTITQSQGAKGKDVY
jgi:hypothetical protein